MNVNTRITKRARFNYS